LLFELVVNINLYKHFILSRIKELFIRKKKNILNVYCTAGFPALQDTIEVMLALQDNGVDMIELGMPYSDPLADGPVIQSSSSKAIANGMSLSVLFEQLKDFRKKIHVPVVLMGYMNPVIRFGFEKFCSTAAAVGIDGIILPDLPLYEFEAECAPVIREQGLDSIFLVTPETNTERILKIDSLSTGFLYAVSSSSTTGKNKDFREVECYLQRLQTLQLKNPVLVGFGIRDAVTFNQACRYAQGAIIGTAFIQSLAESKDIRKSVSTFIQSIIRQP
jgi:tryptophan synthase alpha chain